MSQMTRIAVTVSAALCVGLRMLLQAQTPLFEVATPIPMDGGTGQLALADLNGDGHLDLLVNRVQHGIEVRLGNGRGQFSPAPGGPLALGIDPGATALGDVNADGQPDLVAAHKDRDNEYITVFWGDGHGFPSDGNGGLRRTKRYGTSKAIEFWKPVIRLADVDGNGSTDIVTSNGRRNTIEILLSNDRRGSGPQFIAAPVVTLTPGSSFYTFGVGDFDADGRADLVTTFDSPSTRIEIRKGLGNGRFQEPFGTVDVRAGARVAAVADLNADSHPDVVLSHVDTGWMSVLLNTGRGSFTHAPQSPRDLGLQTYGVVVTDVNRDRRPDIVATTVNSRVPPYDSKVAVLLGDSFTAAAGSPLPVGHGAYQLSVGDIDEDGKPDVVTSSFESDSISVLLGR
jgi:VCBS repeat protein